MRVDDRLRGGADLALPEGGQRLRAVAERLGRPHVRRRQRERRDAALAERALVVQRQREGEVDELAEDAGVPRRRGR